MPFREIGRMQQRIVLPDADDTGAFSVVALCARCGLSRESFHQLRPSPGLPYSHT